MTLFCCAKILCKRMVSVDVSPIFWVDAIFASLLLHNYLQSFYFSHITRCLLEFAPIFLRIESHPQSGRFLSRHCRTLLRRIRSSDLSFPDMYFNDCPAALPDQRKQPVFHLIHIVPIAGQTFGKGLLLVPDAPRDDGKISDQH